MKNPIQNNTKVNLDVKDQALAQLMAEVLTKDITIKQYRAKSLNSLYLESILFMAKESESYLNNMLSNASNRDSVNDEAYKLFKDILNQKFIEKKSGFQEKEDTRRAESSNKGAER